MYFKGDERRNLLWSKCLSIICISVILTYEQDPCDKHGVLLGIVKTHTQHDPQSAYRTIKQHKQSNGVSLIKHG